MAKRDSRSPEEKIKGLEAELADRDRELLAFRQELAEVNKQLEKFINQMDSELKLAGLIQRSLVPTEIPTIPGFEFSTKFVASSVSGGDYFDIFELEDKMRFGILLANSSGHGMASLFMSVLLKLTTQIQARKGLEPADVLKHMTKEIQNNVKGGELSNVFYAIVDRRHYELNYARAGNINAYVYKRSHDKIVRLESTQSAIGKTSKAGSKTESIGLDPRDKLILVSEGVTKVRNRSGQIFGEEKLFELILKNPSANCHEMRNEVLFQAGQFGEGVELAQDMSVVIVQVKDKVLKLKKA